MKKYLLIFLSIIITFSFVGTVSAKVDYSSKIEDKEMDQVKTALDDRGIKNNQKVEIIYDGMGEPSFVLGYGDEGYIIFYRKGLKCIESGEKNPYEDFENDIKYYGGLFDYYIRNDNCYFSVSRKAYVKTIPYFDEFINFLDSDSEDFATALSSVVSTVYVNNRYDYIQRVAFGFNNDDTCTAIACSIILNYLDKTNNNIVPSNYQLPYCNSGKATCATGSTTSVAYLYPNAHNFHRFLADSCSMGAVTYAGNVSSGIATYKNSSSTIASTNITAYWYMPLAVSSIKAQINSSKPCMLTSTFAGVYSWHSMPIYGYRTYDNGSTEYLVHTGWYDSMVKITGSANSYRMPEIWVSSSIATYGYYFTHN